MAADTLPVLSGVVGRQRRSLALWSLAVAAVSAMYVSFYPSIGGAEMESLIEDLPEGLVTALGYDRIGTPGGYLTSTVYGLLGPVLLLVFAIATGARLIAGDEEDGTLELTAPVSRRELYAQRLLALVVDVLLLVAVLTLVTWTIVAALDIEVSFMNILAGSTGLLLLVLGLGTLAFSVGAVTGRRTVAVGVAAGAAVLAFILNAIGPTIDAGWMTAVSPFSWFLGNEPLTNGFDLSGLALLAAVPIVAAVVGVLAFARRDLMV